VGPGGRGREVGASLIGVASVDHREGGGPLVIRLRLVPVETILLVILQGKVQIVGVANVLGGLIVVGGKPLVANSVGVAPHGLVVLGPGLVSLGIGGLVKFAAEGSKGSDHAFRNSDLLAFL
jgi:hypothetical protein